MSEPTNPFGNVPIQEIPFGVSGKDVRCGAQNRSGKPCQKRPLLGRTRCRLHGGITKTKGVSYNATPGSIYSRFLLPEELAAHDTLDLGNVDAELRLVRIRLTRALEMERRDLSGDLEPELESRIERDGGGKGTVYAERHFRKIDYRAAINACLARIESLEKTRMELSKGGTSADGVADQLRALADKLPV